MSINSIKHNDTILQYNINSMPNSFNILKSIDICLKRLKI